MKKQTQAIHLEYERRDAYDSLSVPVYNTLAYEFDNAAVMAEAFTDKIKAPDYSRVENPTVTNLERRVAALTDAAHATAFNSGMAAISNTLMALAAQGKNIVTSKHLFGNTYALLVATLRRFGVKVRLRDLTNIEAVREAIDDDTCCVFLEILTNPQLEVADLKANSRYFKKKIAVTTANIVTAIIIIWWKNALFPLHQIMNQFDFVIINTSSQSFLYFAKKLQFRMSLHEITDFLFMGT